MASSTVRRGLRAADDCVVTRQAIAAATDGETGYLDAVGGERQRRSVAAAVDHRARLSDQTDRR